MAFDRFIHFFPDMAALPCFSSSDKAIENFLVATLGAFQTEDEQNHNMVGERDHCI